MFLFFHKDNFQKMVKSLVIWSHDHVDLLGDHSKVETVEILKNPQSINVLSGKRDEFIAKLVTATAEAESRERAVLGVCPLHPPPTFYHFLIVLNLRNRQ